MRSRMPAIIYLPRALDRGYLYKPNISINQSLRSNHLRSVFCIPGAKSTPTGTKHRYAAEAYISGLIVNRSSRIKFGLRDIPAVKHVHSPVKFEAAVFLSSFSDSGFEKR